MKIKINKKYKLFSFIFVFLLLLFSINLIFAENKEITTIDVTGLSTSEDAEHQHIYKTNYDANNHWEECIICGEKKDIHAHNLQLIGNGPTCDIYVQLGKYVCSDGCGYSKPVERLSHIRPTNPNWADWLRCCHSYFQCSRCGGGGSNGVQEPHRFNINGTIITPYRGDNKGINVHSLGYQKCIDCGLNINLSEHIFYSNNCMLCKQTLGPTGSFSVPENNYYNNIIHIDLINNTTQYVYYKINKKSFTSSITPNASSLYGGNYTVGSPEFVRQEGTNYIYRFPISLKDRNIPITESLRLLAQGYFNETGYIGSDGIRFASTVRSEDSIEVYVDVTKPTIDNVTTKDIITSQGWATAKQINITGKSQMNSIVYISMYHPDGTPIFTNDACVVTNGTYSFSKIPELEVSEEKIFKIVVKDAFGNETSYNLPLSKIDAKSPIIVSPSQTTNEWSKNKEFNISTTDYGIGDVNIAFNDQNSYYEAIKNNNNYIKTYNFIGDVYGDVTATIYAKDKLGNISTSKLKISNIDNTAPTILNQTTHTLDKTYPFATISIQANDYNSKLKKEGSGIKSYALLSEKRNVLESEWQNTSNFKVTENGIYYLYVMDNVGNISDPFEYNVTDIVKGNISLELYKQVYSNDTSLNNDIIKNDFGIENPTFNIILMNTDTNQIIKSYISNQEKIIINNLSVGTYEIKEFGKNLFNFISFEENISDEDIEFVKENDKYYIRIKKELIKDQKISLNSKSDLINPEVMNETDSKNNLIAIK